MGGGGGSGVNGSSLTGSRPVAGASKTNDLPPAIAKRYEEAKLAVTMVGMLLLNTSAIIGLATLIRPMPPVHNMAEKKNITGK